MRDHPLLDNPVWHALGGPHASFAETGGRLRRYHPKVAGFAAAETPEDRAGFASFLPPGDFAVFVLPRAVEPPEGLETVMAGEGAQFVADAPQLAPVAVAYRDLGPADVPAIMELVELTQPGPMAPRTIELGRYIGVHDGDRLVAMAGERMHLPGYTEVSAVCTHPDYRGRGIGKQLISVICAGILARGETPFLHVRAGNAEAIGVYERLGFELRTPVIFTVLKHKGTGNEAIPTFLRPHD